MAADPWPRFFLRSSLAVLALMAAPIGLMASFAPREFYESFPLGLGWVELLPPYNEHLTTDVGGFYLAFTVLFAWGGVTLRRNTVVPVACAWLVAGTLHAAFHVLHLEGFSTGDAIAQTTGFALTLALAVVALAFRNAGEQP